jgi:hypothetical protein
MKRFSALILIFWLSFASAWGTLGHKIVANLAERHLSDSARKHISQITGNQPLASLSNWADRIRYNPRIKNPHSNWHYLNINSEKHWQCIKHNGCRQEDIRTGLKSAIHCLKNPHHVRCHLTQKNALRWLIHLVGDIHQPLHLGHHRDQGGNLIKIHYHHKNTNLHALWDSKILKYKTNGKSAASLAAKWDTLSDKEIRTIQDSKIIDWIGESHQITQHVAYRTSIMNHHTTSGYQALPITYTQKAWPIIRYRIQEAGMRLAAVLNTLWPEHK